MDEVFAWATTKMYWKITKKIVDEPITGSLPIFENFKIFPKNPYLSKAVEWALWSS